jgi:hypothetical protein
VALCRGCGAQRPKESTTKVENLLGFAARHRSITRFCGLELIPTDKKATGWTVCIVSVTKLQ